MARSPGLSQALARSPGLVVSTVLTCMVGALLPPLPGLTLFAGGLGLAAVLCAGVEPDHGRADALLAQQRDRRRQLSCLCLAQDPSTAQQPDRRLLQAARRARPPGPGRRRRVSSPAMAGAGRRPCMSASCSRPGPAPGPAPA